MKESSFESLVDFATDDQIFRLIAEERGKYAARIPKKATNPFGSDPLFSKC